MARSKYGQLVLNIIATSPARCVKREILIEEIAKQTGEPRDRVENALGKLLRQFVARGMLERKNGYYCLK
jgi:hypothetical protein